MKNKNKGLIAVFYDRKNNQEVKNTELCFINYTVELAVIDSCENAKKILNSHDLQLGELGYKSKECHSYRNWDLTCMYTDLIFLRFE